MIRFIDLRHHADDIGERFAFWDTVIDRFVSDDMGNQAWETIGQFAQGYKPTDSQPLKRFVGLAPEWAKHSPPEREVYKIELRVADGMPLPGAPRQLTHAHAQNEDGSAACHVPLSPLVLGALQGRKITYFYGEQVYGYDASVGAIEGQIVIDFNDEAEGQTW